jgi:predicted Zn-dependent protease with MMP-like domain
VTLQISQQDFKALVDSAFEALPKVYREACRDLTIRVEPQASEEVLAALGIVNPFELLGLYHGVSLTKRSNFTLPGLPDEVIIYRDPIVAYAQTSGLALSDTVRHVLIHEIGHHFGFSDADMERIERD